MKFPTYLKKDIIQSIIFQHTQFDFIKPSKAHDIVWVFVGQKKLIDIGVMGFGTIALHEFKNQQIAEEWINTQQTYIDNVNWWAN